MSQYLLHQVWVSDLSFFARSSRRACLNTFFIRYGCRTEMCSRSRHARYVSIPSSSGMGVGRNILLPCRKHKVSIPSSSGMGVGLKVLVTGMLGFVSIPSSSGMGVGHLVEDDVTHNNRLNTFFIRYGCRTLRDMKAVASAVSIPSSSGMGVGPRKWVSGIPRGVSQYLLHQVWVSDGESRGVQPRRCRLNTFFIRYGCRT